MKPKILSKKVEYECDWIKIEGVRLRLASGEISKQKRIFLRDFVAIVPIDDKFNVYLVKEYRSAWEKEIYQIPAGNIRKQGEKEILKQAHNELREEVGLDARRMEKILTFPVSSRINQKMNLYLAQDLFPSSKKPDPDEIVEVVKMPFRKAYKLFLKGKMQTTIQTILGMVLAKEKLKL
jgi:8-oxo-dGTP pyrophosphatase MutT (NUDIX family)